MKKFLALLMTLALLLPALVACGSPETPADTTAPADSGSDSESVSDTPAETEPVPQLPEVTYDGAKYTILTAAEQWQSFYTVEAEDVEGDVVAQAIYDRNTAVSNQFDVELDYVIFNGYSAGVATVGNALMDSVSGSRTYDLAVASIQYITPHVVSGYFADLNQPEYSYLGLEQPWWYQLVNKEIDISGRQFLAAGYYGLTSISFATVVFFNQKLIEDNNFENMYTLVRENKWTLDKMLEMAEKAKVDMNSDGIYDYQNDILGLISTYDYTAGGIKNGCGYQFITRDEAGVPKLTGANEKIIDLNEIVYNLYAADYYLDTYTVAKTDTYNAMFKVFANDQALFMMHRVESATSDILRDMGDYGIIPCPLYNEEQEHYLTSGVPEIIGIPADVNDEEFSSVICEALNYESWKTVRPAYFESALKEKYARDPDTQEMLEIIMTNTVTDFAYIYGRSIGSGLNGYIGKTDNYASWAASNLPTYEAALEDLVEQIEKIGKE